MDQVKKLADEYNAIGAVSGKAGLQQGLHHEGFENSMVGGRRVFDVLFELLDPALVKFQFQVSTIRSGMVAAEYFTKHPGRFISMHLQDLDLNAPPAPPTAAGRGGGPPARPIGQGSIDWVGDVQGREDRRRAELLRGDEHRPDEGERAVPQGADGLATGDLR